MEEIDTALRYAKADRDKCRTVECRMEWNMIIEDILKDKAEFQQQLNGSRWPYNP